MRRVATRLTNYLKHDFKEIVLPSSIPDLPGDTPEKEKRRSLKEWGQVRVNLLHGETARAKQEYAEAHASGARRSALAPGVTTSIAGRRKQT